MPVIGGRNEGKSMKIVEFSYNIKFVVYFVCDVDVKYVFWGDLGLNLVDRKHNKNPRLVFNERKIIL